MGIIVKGDSLRGKDIKDPQSKKSWIEHVGNAEWCDLRLTPEEAKKANQSEYKPTDEEKEIRAMIIRQFSLGYLTMYTPRREFNDLSVIGRMTVDQMSFNTYQPNNGETATEDVISGWRSNAIRPIVRNKCISIAAHATAQLIFPKVFSYNGQSEVQEDAARVMRDLIEWSADQSKYSETSLNAVLSALFNPASIYYTEYGEVYRNVKKEQDEGGKWKVEKMLDEDMSGFKDTPVPVDELYIENFYESNIQKQGWLIWRRVYGYDQMAAKYDHYDNFKYVKPGVQIIYNDLNQTFYEVYDSNMRTESCEEVIYWNKRMDLKLIMVNGVLLTTCDNPNPRTDKLYPFVKFIYENLDEGRCFYGKSLAFKMQSDANIVNTLYPMVIDRSYLSVFPPMVSFGSETIGSDVIIPGGVTQLSDTNSKLNAVMPADSGIKDGLEMLMEVEKSVSESSEEPVVNGQSPGADTTAYEISRLEQNANTILGLFLQMIASYVRQYGRLRIGDILQYLTILDADKITDDPKLVYKSFLVKGSSKTQSKKIEFTGDMPDSMTQDEMLKHSNKIKSREDQLGMEIARVNPGLFRDLCYQLVVTPDVMHPRSDDLERAMKLELYDRAIQNPRADQDKVFKDFLLGAYKDIKEPDDYIAPQQPQGQPGQNNQPGQLVPGQAPTAQPSPIAAMSKMPLPQSH